MRKKIVSIKKILIISVSALLSAILTLTVLFWIFIVLGSSKTLQETWICTAMHTYTHQYLATWFFSDEKIEEVLNSQKVDDSAHDSVLPSGENSNTVQSKKPVGNDEIYESEGYRKLSEGVYIKEVSGTSGVSNWFGYAMLVSDPTRIRLVDTPAQFDHGWTVMEMVESVGGVAGINGGGFNDGPNYDSNGGSPTGLLIENGVLVNPSVPNGETYNMIGFDALGNFILRHTTAAWAMENDIMNAVSFSPYIVVNGEGMVKNGTGGWGISPRTGLGQRETGEVIFVVIDGRQIGYSIGCDLDGLQKVMLDEKCINGAMMDGGSSTAMVHGGEYINRPSLGHERWINNAWVVMPAK